MPTLQQGGRTEEILDMRRTNLSAAMLAALASPPETGTRWSQQPLQQHMGPGDNDGDGDGDGDGTDGDGDGDGSDGDGDGDGDGTDGDGDGSDGDGDGDKKLGPAGQKAFEANKRKLREERTRRQELERELREAKAGKSDGKSGDDAKEREIEERLRIEYNERTVRSEVRAAAAGKLADPKDAVRLLDLSEFEVDRRGNVDEDAINDAIDELLEKKPYLAAQSGKKRTPRPDRRQGGAGGRKVSGVDVGKAEAARRFASKK